MNAKVPNVVIIRMYDVGFGDSFLLRLPTPDRRRQLKVLIDCGTFAKGRNEMRDVVRSILAAAADGEADGTPRLDVVVATHRHKDHVDAFHYPDWEQVEVKEVWMPWTEKPDDEDAQRLRLLQQQCAERLAAALVGRGEQIAATNVLALALKNEAAMQVLWDGFAGQPHRRYLPPKNELPFAFRSAALPGVGVWVLGPSRDEAVIRDLEPPASQSYLRGGVAADAGAPPFPVDLPTYTPGQFARSSGHRHLALGQRMERAVDRASLPQDPLAIAAQLDQVINGTSLMLVLKVGKAHLLFPGDAQWGTWESVLATPACRDLVRQADFYKVSHHASHNGTPVDFVEKLLKRSARAMISVRHYSQWPDIPRSPLLRQITERCGGRVVRSDKARVAGAPWYTVGEDNYAKFVETRVRC